jgi:hypothetical protein
VAPRDVPEGLAEADTDEDAAANAATRVIPHTSAGGRKAGPTQRGSDLGSPSPSHAGGRLGLRRPLWHYVLSAVALLLIVAGVALAILFRVSR